MDNSIEVGCYQFNYYSTGNSSNLPILFLHGFLGDCLEFAESMLLLSDRFYCLSLDLPGHGKTKVKGDYSSYEMKETCTAIIYFLESLNICRVILVGYSMGGRLALYLALNYPNYFSKVILESASPGLKTTAEREARVSQDFALAQELESIGITLFLDKWYSQPLFASIKKRSDFAKILQRRRQNNEWELAKSLRYLSTGMQPPLWEKISCNVVPLQLLVGELDPKFIGINREMASVCLAAKLEIASGCGHNIHLEEVGLFIDKIDRFINN